MAAVAGRTYPAVRFEIEAKRVADFARAIGADPSDGAPPTLTTLYSSGVTAPQLFGDDEAAVDFTRLLHVDQQLQRSRQTRDGETVISHARAAADSRRC